MFSLITCVCCGLFGIPFPLLAVALGGFSLMRQSKEPDKFGGKPFAIAGIAIGGVSLVFTIILVVLGVGGQVMQNM